MICRFFGASEDLASQPTLLAELDETATARAAQALGDSRPSTLALVGSGRGGPHPRAMGGCGSGHHHALLARGGAE